MSDTVVRVVTVAGMLTAFVVAEFLGQGSNAAARSPVCGNRLHRGLVRHFVRRTLDCLYAGRMMLQQT